MTITGRLYFGGNSEYYIDPNYDDSSWYIWLPGFRVDEASGAVFSGKLSAPSGTIGGFNIKTTAIYKTKTSYSSTTAGVYIGTDGIGLGAGTFYVTSAGALTCKSGNIGGFTIGTTSIYNTKTAYSDTTAGVYIGTDGIGLGAGTFYVTSAGALTAKSGTIGGFTIGTSSIYKTKTSYSSTTAGVYIGTDGIGLGAGTFYVTSAGSLTAKSGTIGGFTIGTSSIYKTKTAYSNTTAGVYIGTDGIGLGAGTFYVSSAGAMTCTSGSIAGFTISSTSIRHTKTSYSDSSDGVYIGTTGIGLGAGTFYVTSAGVLTATSATITGSVTATSGTVQNLTITGKLYFGNNTTYYLNANYNDSSYYIYLPGFRVDDASGSVFSGKLSAASGSFSGTITATGGKIGNLNISDGGLVYGTVSTDNVATGVKINTAGIWAKEGHFSSGSFGYWFLSTSGYFWALYNRSLDIYLKSSGPTLGSSSASWASIITTANSSSDARVKKDIESLDSKYSTFFDKLTPCRFRYIDGTSGRYHTGFIAQDVVQALTESGLDTQQFAGAVLWSPGTEDESWHLRKDEFVALNTWEIQKLKAEVAQLKKLLENNK
jgi:hypothetical protein